MPEIQIEHDEIAERLDELADLASIWNKHRQAGRTPSATRQAMIMVIKEISFYQEIEDKDLLGKNRQQERL